jgi:hypothetical protein
VRASKTAAASVVASTFITLLLPATAATADQGDTLKGGCGFTTISNPTAAAGVTEGVIYDASISQEASGLPSDATVSCWITVNGVEQPSTRITATDDRIPGVEVGQQPISFSAFDTDLVTECQSVMFADGSTWTTDCRATTTIQIPPQSVIDAINALFALPRDDINPVLCPILVELASVTGGGVLGVIRLNPDGDIYVAQPLGRGYIQTYDCAPYNTEDPGVSGPNSILYVGPLPSL